MITDGIIHFWQLATVLGDVMLQHGAGQRSVCSFLMKRTLSFVSVHINLEAPSHRLVAPSHRLECSELHYSQHKRVEFDLLLGKSLCFSSL